MFLKQTVVVRLEMKRMLLLSVLTVFSLIPLFKMLADKQTRPVEMEPEGDDSDCQADGSWDDEMLMFYRIPKTGGTTFNSILKQLAYTNGFTRFTSHVYDQREIDKEEQRTLIDVLSRYERPLSYDRHLHFIPFHEFEAPVPIKFSVVREPAERLNSRFYYHRTIRGQPHFANLVKDGLVSDTFETWKKRDLEACLKNSLPECTLRDGMRRDLQIPYFCGQDEYCMLVNDPRALAQAKENVLRYFPVVGVLEMMDQTFQVLEDTLPLFFFNVSNTYRELNGKRKNRTQRKRKLNNATGAILRKSMTDECEFYQFLVQRLQTQFANISKSQR